MLFIMFCLNSLHYRDWTYALFSGGALFSITPLFFFQLSIMFIFSSLNYAIGCHFASLRNLMSAFRPILFSCSFLAFFSPSSPFTLFNRTGKLAATLHKAHGIKAQISASGLELSWQITNAFPASLSMHFSPENLPYPIQGHFWMTHTSKLSSGSKEVISFFFLSFFFLRRVMMFGFRLWPSVQNNLSRTRQITSNYPKLQIGDPAFSFWLSIKRM